MSTTITSAYVPQCPDCSRVLTFRHAETTVLQCACGSVINRKEGGLLFSKPFYVVQSSVDLIEPGTTGKWNDLPFTVLGRIRAWMEEFVFNYWTIEFSDGTLAYLGEGYGQYAVYLKTQIDVFITPNELEQTRVGGRKELKAKIGYQLERKYTCYRWEVEGEVFLPEVNEGFSIYEFASSTGKHIELISFLKNSVVPFDVYYTSFSGLQLENTRAIPVEGKTFHCASCSNKILVKTFPYAQSCVCGNCQTRFALQDGTTFKKVGSRNATDHKPDIPLGSVGEIKGITYEVIGFALKEENNKYRSRWKEYVLYNQAEGYAFLSEFSGHWIYLREQGDAPVISEKEVKEMVYDEEPFQLYNAYTFDTINALGEFPYNIFNDGDKYVREYISPPEMWTQEKNNREGIIWFKGEHVNPSEITNAFNGAVLPYKSGVGAIEPKGFISPAKLGFISFIAALLFIFVHIGTSISKQERVILDQMYVFPDSVSTLTIVTKPFQLDKWKSNLEFQIEAAVENSWFELGATLVNTKTGTEYSFEKGVEYYKGYSDGEYWTEGSTSEKAYLDQIPEGVYTLQFQCTRESSLFDMNKVSSFSILVLYDVPNHRNLIVCLILMLIFPVIKYLLIQKNEKARWYNSPFSPYSYEH